MPDTILGLGDNHREHNYLKTLPSWNLHSNYIPHLLKTTLREVGGGIGMGKTCEPKAFSFQCMTKFTTNKNNKLKKKKTTLLPLSPYYRGAKWGSENLCSLSGFSQPELNPVLLDSKAWASSPTNSVAGPATKTKVLLSQTTFCQGCFFFFFFF